MAEADPVKRDADLPARVYNGHAMRKIWRDTLDKVTPYEAGPPLEQVEQELGLPSVIRLSANESPLGASPKVAESLRREAERVHLYPDGGSQRVRAALGEWVGVDPAWLVVGNGADELIGFLARAAFGPGDEVVVPHPSFEPRGATGGRGCGGEPAEQLRDGPGRHARARDGADQGGVHLHAA